MQTGSRWAGPVRLGKPQGVAAVVAGLVWVSYILSGGTYGEALIVPLPFGLTRGMLAGVTVVLFLLLFGIQLFRGEVTSSADSPTTLDLSSRK